MEKIPNSLFVTAKRDFMDDETFNVIISVIRDWKAHNSQIAKEFRRSSDGGPIQWKSMKELEKVMYEEIERRNKINRVEKKLDRS